MVKPRPTRPLLHLFFKGSTLTVISALCSMSTHRPHTVCVSLHQCVCVCVHASVFCTSALL